MSARDSGLPIEALRPRLSAAIEPGCRLVIRAPTGSGKSTQIPQMIADSGRARGQVVVLQPRRLAARMLAARVARERGCQLGGEVGYQIRFDNRSGPETKIVYLTEGILVRRMIGDPSLSGVGTLVFDEFHERHLDADLSLALALSLQKGPRPDLLLAVMSATLESSALLEYLAPAHLLESEGRTHPVEIRHLHKNPAPDETPWELAGREVEARIRETEGHTLVFMPGSYEINRTMDEIRARIRSSDAAVMPLHGELPPDQQDAAVSPSDRRKIIVATNVAETSITVEGVTSVVDSGLARVARYDPHRGINTLLVEKISRASADQRAGRAGRTAPGVCVRLWSKTDHDARPAFDQPEIRRVDLAETMLFLKAHGLGDPGSFAWFDPPDPKSVARAEELLRDLGAADPATGEITRTGRLMLDYPVHPRYARMFIEAAALGCFPAAAMIAALSQSRGIFLRNRDRRVAEKRDDLFGGEGDSDFFPLMRAMTYASRQNFDPRACDALGIHGGAARQVSQIHGQLLKMAPEGGAPTAPSDANIRRCMLAGFADHLAKRADASSLRCDIVHGRKGVLDRESKVTDAPLLVAAEIHEIGSSGGDLRTQISLNTAVEMGWLRDMFPAAFRSESEVYFDATARRVRCRRRTLFRDLVLEEESGGDPTDDEAARILAREVATGRLILKSWDDACDQWVARVNCLAAWTPELEIPRIGPEEKIAILESVCHGARGYKDIKDADIWPSLRDWLGPEHRGALESMAPAHYDLASGRRAKIRYAEGSPPVMASRIQDFFGMRGEITIAGGRVPVRIELCAPSMRPVQITLNLDSFWKESYPSVRVELMRKYPKHKWPEPSELPKG